MKFGFRTELNFRGGYKPDSAAGKSVSCETEFRGARELLCLRKTIKVGHAPCNSIQREG